MKKTPAIILAIMLTIMTVFVLCSCGKTASGGGKATAKPQGTPAGNDPGGDPGVSSPEPGGTDHQPVAGSEGLEIRERDDSCLLTGVGSFTGAELVVPSHVNGKPVTSVDEDAFGDTSIVSLTLPWTVVSLGEECFGACRLLETVTFSEGLQMIGYGSFVDCVSIKTLTFPASLESVGNSAFRECSGLEEVTFLGNASLGNMCFSDCTSLKKVTFSGTDKRSYSFKSEAFANNTSLETAVFSEGLKEIGSWCFSGCTALKTVSLPKSLTKIDVSAFQNTGLEKVYFEGNAEEWSKIGIGSNNEALLNAEIIFNNR